MPNKKALWWLPLFFLICYGVAAFGAMFPPGEWYAELQRAPWNPPNIAFPIAWSILYACIAVAGWIIFALGTKPLKMLWCLQLIFNALWSWLFFGQHWILIGLIDLLLVLTSVWLLLRGCLRARLKIAAWLLMPYFLWLSLAATLNAYIYLYN